MGGDYTLHLKHAAGALLLAASMSVIPSPASAQAATPAASTAPVSTPPVSNNDSAVTPQQLLDVRGFSDLHFSPDGLRLACVVSEPAKGATRPRHIWMLDVRTKAFRQFTSSAKSEDWPRWSPDGKRLAFISDREEERHIYLIPADGGEATRLSKGKQSVQSFAWSPDGKQIAFIASEPKTDAEEKKEKDKDDARVVDKDEKLTRLWLMNVDGDLDKPRQLTSGRWQVSDVEWVPDSSRLLVVATDHPESDDDTERLFTAATADGKLTELAAPRGPFRALRISPDGKSAAYLGSRVDGPSPHDLYVLPITGGAPKNLSADSLDRPVLAYEWTSANEILATIQDGFKTALASISAAGAVHRRRDLPRNPRAFAVSKTGAIAFAGGDALHPEELWLASDGAPQPVSHLNAAWEKLKLIAPEIVHFTSFDGVTIEGALLKPADYRAGARVPLVVLIHGGPTGAWTDSIESWGQLLAAHGYAILYPNIRGSTGYGHKFIEMNRGDWGGADFRDVMAGVDYLIAQGIADPGRLGIGGWSYGGYMAEWAITQTNRFKAAVSGAGLSNLVSEFGTEQGPRYDQWFFGVPYENLDGFMKSSPLRYLKNARTPTLILQGDADTVDPLGQSQELYRGLKHYGVEAQLVVYPREPHGFREEKHLLDRLDRMLAWYESHLH